MAFLKSAIKYWLNPKTRIAVLGGLAAIALAIGGIALAAEQRAAAETAFNVALMLAAVTVFYAVKYLIVLAKGRKGKGGT